MRWCLWLSVFAIGCGDEVKVSMVVEPREGIAPLKVRMTADAIAKEGAKIQYRFDFEGDGTFDTEPSEEPSVEHEYGEGAFRPKVEASIEGALGTTTAEVQVRANQPPAPKLDASPLMGRQPVLVTLDASGSIDPDGEPNPLEARFDFDGDGEFDTEFAGLGPVTHSYSVKGTFTPKVEVRDFRGGLAVGSGPPITVLPGVDIDADFDRDGLITDDDDDGEDTFSPGGGAVFLANVDDDDGDGRQDWQDMVVSGMEDMSDLARVVIAQYPELPAEAVVTLSTGGSEYVRIFREEAAGVNVLLGPGTSTAQLDPGSLSAGDVHLFVEGISPRTSTWDGTMELTLTIAIPGEEEQVDRVLMRVSPVLFPDNLQEARILYLMRITEFGLGPNLEFFNAVAAAMPEGVELYDVSQYDYVGDRWVQDNMQTGYQAMPSEGGPHLLQTYLETVRTTGADGLEYFVTRERIGADYGYVFTGGMETSLNYGGNLEIAPPFTAGGVEYPFGRTLVGGGAGGTLMGRAYEDHMVPPQRAFLDAQVQGPTVELSSEWLYVGHLDEFIQFVPNPNRTNGRDWMLVFASPLLAVESLERLEAAGLGSTPVFQGRSTGTTVSAILADAQLMAYQEAAQARLDTIRDELRRAMELTDADVVEVPVLYEPIVFFGEDYAVAYNPGIQNLVTVRDLLLVPDPEGPEENGIDIWQGMTREVLEPLGVRVEFVDIFESYHLNFGEAHCGTEVEHAPYQQLWWEKE